MIDTDTITQPSLDFEALHQIGGEEGLSLDPARLEGATIDGLSPRAIVRPESNEQAAEFLKYAYQRGLKVAIQGGGTKRGLGNPITGLDLVLSTERLNNVLEYSPADLMLGVQAGANLQEIQRQLELNGQFLPIASPLSSKATIGGAIAANTSGPARLLYGPARDWLIGVRFALAEGLLAHGGGRVVKNVAGYDMMKVFIGSLGTLGLILDMNFKLMPLPKAGATMLLSFAKEEDACNAALKIIDAGLFPNALTVLDSRAAKMLDINAPEAATLLLVEFCNTARAVERQTSDAVVVCQEFGSVKVERIEDEPTQKQIWRAITDFAYADNSSSEKSFALKAGILPDQSADILEFAHQTAAQHNLEISGLAHAGHGLVYLLGKYEAEDEALIVINHISRRAEAQQGSLTVERVPLSLKRRLNDVWGKALSEGEIKLMRGIKAKLDPQNILNPGRYVARI